MNEAMEYLIECSDKGDLQEFLEKCGKDKKCIYKGNNAIDLHIYKGQIVKVTHKGINLKVVSL